MLVTSIYNVVGPIFNLVFIVFFLLWLAYKMRKPIFMEVFEREATKVVHAQRSDDWHEP